MAPSLQSIISRLRLKHLQLLIALDDHRSLHKAAKVTFISQPGATKSLREIEDALGMQLFERMTKGIEPNDAGACVIRYARLVYSDLAHMREEIVGLMQGYGGYIAVGTIMGAVPSLTYAIQKLRAIQPTVSIEIVEDTSSKLMSLLSQGRIDLAIGRESMGQRLAAYDSIELSEEPLAVIANKQHPLSGIRNLHLQDLSDVAWIAYPSNMPMRQSLEHAINEAGLEAIRHPIETSSTFSTLMLLQQDPSLVAVVPQEVAKYCVSVDILSCLDIYIPSLMGPHGVVKRAGYQLSPEAHLLVSELFKSAGKDYDASAWDN
ncbi:LysR family transcriptional regulator [Salinicola sp. CR57]|uniref:LysR family transcriptional regulator n=1 Tax=Salinicola sp. CR57 TaxID=1949086 RepID=UPI000DA22945|nr:LysR family transcriptional regulator [Salinicola sp. CR57]